MLYLWVKTFHIVFVISWFAGIFYLPRLFVHHAMSDDAATQERLAIMEGKLYRFTTPIAFLSIGLGIWMMALNSAYLLSAGWLHVKITLVAGLLAYHFYLGHLARQFAAGNNTHSHKFYRIINEIPVLALLAIVALVVIKPF
ncbi:Uncharacterised protein [BD1-7 clade bacterium]|uniref:Protoporphyrinogen IX oxidase n=1 Tax=BD1-7 clade bacterium TaxID=2029982 RepID=A0A5S9MN83_9GAMM|nr:Uncharacterised protein [BD1-7 clade bacterium]CAA0085435.1 Uncharacterised protein [BD1-7 clade bacterium]